MPTLAGFKRAAPAVRPLFGAAFLLAFAFGFAPARAQDSTFDCVLEPSLIVKLGSPVASILQDVLAERGDIVKRGQVVAHLESWVEQAAVDYNRARAESSAEIEAKSAVLLQKTGVRNRKRGLLSTHVASSQDVENSEAEYNVAKQELALAVLNKQMAEIDLRRSQALLDQRAIKSPIDGVVTQRNLGPGEYVNQEAYIVTVARIDPLHVETYLPVARLRPHQDRRQSDSASRLAGRRRARSDHIGG